MKMEKYFKGYFIPNKPKKKGEKFKFPEMPLDDAESFAVAYGTGRGGGFLKGKLITKGYKKR